MTEDQELTQIETEIALLNEIAQEVAAAREFTTAIEQPTPSDPEPVVEVEKPKKAKKAKKETVEVETVKVPETVKKESPQVLFGAAKLKAKFLKR